MKEKIKKVLTLLIQWKVILIILLIGIGAGLFYWFQIRPSRIYSVCDKVAVKAAQKLYKEKYPWASEEMKKGYFDKSDYDYYYKRCLRRKGINK